jgi:hypothetical protein
MKLIDLITILQNNHKITVSNSVVKINGIQIGNCYSEDDGSMVFDLIVLDTFEKFNLDEIYDGEMTAPQMVHVCLHSLMDGMEDKGLI